MSDLGCSSNDNTAKFILPSRPTRILMVTPQPFFEDRGTPIALRFVASALGEAGYEVDLLSFPLGRSVEIPGVTLSRCANPLSISRVPVGFSWRKLALDATLMYSFAGHLQRKRYDLVHAVEEAAYMAAALCPPRAIPFIYDMASAIPRELSKNPLFRRMQLARAAAMGEKQVLDRAGHVICSMGLRSYVLQQAPETELSEWRFPAMSRLVGGAAPAALRRSLGIGRDDRVILYSGNFAAYQGVELLLQAFEIARVSAPELMLVCVGATVAERERLLAALSAETAARVRIVLRQRRRDMPIYMAASDFLISPRVGTGNLPLKIFDYLAAGRPVVATRGVAHEPTLNSSRAVLCDPEPAAMAKAMLDLLASPHRAAELTRNALTYSAQHLSWGTFAAFLDATYQKTLLPQSRRGAQAAAA